MATTLFTTLYDEVLTEVAGVTQPVALNAIKQAAIEFCDRAWVWIVDQGPIPVAALANTFDWEPPSGTEAVRPMQVWLDKRPLVPKTANELSELYGDFMQAEGSPACFVQNRPDQLIVVPKPVNVQPGEITAKLAVKPTQAATGMESVILSKFRDAICHGAKARLYRMPRKPWSNGPSATYYQGMFDNTVSTGQVAVIRGFAGARARVKAHFF